MDEWVSDDSKYPVPPVLLGVPPVPQEQRRMDRVPPGNAAIEQSDTDAHGESSPKMASPFCVLPVGDVKGLVLSTVI